MWLHPSLLLSDSGCAGCGCGALTFILAAIPCIPYILGPFGIPAGRRPLQTCTAYIVAPFGPPWRSSLCTMSPFLPQSRSLRSQSPPPSREVEVANLGPLKTEADGEEVCLPLGSKVLEQALAVTRSPSLRKCCKLALCDYGSLRTRAGLGTCKEDLGGPRGVPEAQSGTPPPPPKGPP